MVAEMLSARVAMETDYDEAWAAEVEVMKRGFGAGFTGITWTRDELHERGV